LCQTDVFALLLAATASLHGSMLNAITRIAIIEAKNFIAAKIMVIDIFLYMDT
jgi:hypothetical protein